MICLRLSNWASFPGKAYHLKITVNGCNLGIWRMFRHQEGWKPIAVPISKMFLGCMVSMRNRKYATVLWGMMGMFSLRAKAPILSKNLSPAFDAGAWVQRFFLDDGPTHIVIGIFTIRLYHLKLVPIFQQGLQTVQSGRSKTAKASLR